MPGDIDLYTCRVTRLPPSFTFAKRVTAPPPPQQVPGRQDSSRKTSSWPHAIRGIVALRNPYPIIPLLICWPRGAVRKHGLLMVGGGQEFLRFRVLGRRLPLPPTAAAAPLPSYSDPPQRLLATAAFPHTIAERLMPWCSLVVLLLLPAPEHVVSHHPQPLAGWRPLRVGLFRRRRRRVPLGVIPIVPHRIAVSIAVRDPARGELQLNRLLMIVPHHVDGVLLLVPMLVVRPRPSLGLCVGQGNSAPLGQPPAVTAGVALRLFAVRLLPLRFVIRLDTPNGVVVFGRGVAHVLALVVLLRWLDHEATAALCAAAAAAAALHPRLPRDYYVRRKDAVVAGMVVVMGVVPEQYDGGLVRWRWPSPPVRNVLLRRRALLLLLLLLRDLHHARAGRGRRRRRVSVVQNLTTTTTTAAGGKAHHLLLVLLQLVRWSW